MRPAATRADRSQPGRPARALSASDTAGPEGVGRASRSSSSARARPGRSRRATSSSTARPCCASSRRRGPTSCACTRSAPDNPHGLEGAPMYDGLNVGKRNVTLNLKQPGCGRARDAARRRVGRRGRRELRAAAMKGFGLDYDALAAIKPDLVMISACLNGQTGPHKDYPGFGGQGSALGGLQRAHRLARPRARRPVRHDHRLARAALRRGRARRRAALPPAHRPRRVPRRRRRSSRRSGRCRRGCSTTRSTASSACATATGTPARRRTARSRAPTKTASATAGSRSRAGRRRLGDARAHRRHRRSDARHRRRPHRARGRGRSARTGVDADRTRAEVAEQLQAAGIEAVPVQDFGDLHDDPQLAHRGHFEPHTHPFLGAGLYERNGFRLSRLGGLRPGRTDARPGQRLGARRRARSRRRRIAALRASGAVE